MPDKVLICQWCFEEPAVEGKTVCQACIDAANEKEDDDFDLDAWLDEINIERLSGYDLPRYVKEDLIDLLDEHPDLLEMTAEELKKVVQDKYWTAQGYFDRGNRLESDAASIEKYCIAKYGEEQEP